MRRKSKWTLTQEDAFYTAVRFKELHPHAIVRIEPRFDRDEPTVQIWFELPVVDAERIFLKLVALFAEEES